MAIITVGPSGRDYTTIQDAVAAASNGDTIRIYSATYTKSGTDPVVDGNSYATGLILQAMEPEIIIDCQSTNAWGIRAGQGWAIRGVGSGVFLTIRDVATSDFTSAGIYGGSSAVTVRDVIITGSVNRGIYLASSSTVERVKVATCGDRAIVATTIRNFLVYNCGNSGMYVVDGTTVSSGTLVMRTASDGMRATSNARNNVVLAIGCTPVYGITGGTHTYNHVYGTFASGYLATGPAGTGDVTGADAATADLEDVTAHDYRPTETSPLRGAGVDLSADFTDDLIGTARVAWDVGALEYVPPPPPTVTDGEATERTTIVVTLDRELTGTELASTSDWTVTPTTGGVAVSVTAVSISGATATLTVSALTVGGSYLVAANTAGSPASTTVVFEVLGPSATERWVSSEIQLMFNALLPGNRADATQNRILLDLFEAAARLRVYTRAKMVGLRKLLDPSTLPDEWLPKLGGNVLLTNDLGIPGHLTADQWRAIIPTAGEMWRRKGVDYRPILVALTGRPVWIGGWHDLRHQLDVTDGLPLLGYDAADDDATVDLLHEYRMTIHVPDPFGVYPAYTPADGEEAVNRDLVRLLIDAVRPSGQRVDVFFFDWLDDFSQGIGRWSSEAGRAPAWDSDAYTMTLDSLTDGAEVVVQQVAGDVSAQWEYATWELWVKLSAAVRTEVRLRHDGTDYYELRITPSATDPTAGALTLVHTSGGTVDTYTAATVPLDEWLFIAVTCAPVEGGDDEWTVDLDGERVLEGTLAAQANTGPMQLRIAANQTMAVQLVEQYQATADSIRVGPED